jgi:hypothetical protein
MLFRIRSSVFKELIAAYHRLFAVVQLGVMLGGNTAFEQFPFNLLFRRAVGYDVTIGDQLLQADGTFQFSHIYFHPNRIWNLLLDLGLWGLDLRHHYRLSASSWRLDHPGRCRDAQRRWIDALTALVKPEITRGRRLHIHGESKMLAPGNVDAVVAVGGLADRRREVAAGIKCVVVEADACAVNYAIAVFVLGPGAVVRGVDAAHFCRMDAFQLQLSAVGVGGGLIEDIEI